MKIYNEVISIISASIGIVFGFLYGCIPEIFLVLIALASLDFLTGLVSAYVNKQLSSKVSFNGILRKVVMFIVVAMAHMIDKALNLNIVMNATIMFYIANECLSIIENSSKIGLPIPQKIIEALEQIKEDDKDEA